jgi:hypothetical protein
VKDENGDQIADSHNIFNRWKNYFSHLLNANRVSDIRQIEIIVHRPGPLVLFGHRSLSFKLLDAYGGMGATTLLLQLEYYHLSTVHDSAVDIA